MPVDTVLYNAMIITDKGLTTAGIAIDKNRILKIAKKPNLPKASKNIDLEENVVLPGLIDSHVHLRDQQLAYREDFTSGTMAAAAGGVTTVVDMPNNQPTTMSVKTLTERMQLAQPQIIANVAFNSAFPTQLDEIPKIVTAGAVGFKLYLLEQIGGINIDDDNALTNAFKVASRTKTPIAAHAEDKTIVEQAKKTLVEQGRADLEAFLEAHPAKAEEKATERIIEISRKSGAHLHVCHVSSQLAMKAILKAKKHGYHVTCEVTPHHLLLTTKHLKKYRGLAVEIPPLRTHSDVDYLWRQLQHGFVDTIGSDHAPHAPNEKTAESIWNIKPGIVGLETMLPLLLTQVNKELLTLQQLVNLACRRPAEIYHLQDRGMLAAGSLADLVVVNLKKEHRIDASQFHSKAKFSPFDGWKVKGFPVKTLVNGKLVMDESEIVAQPGCGQIIKGRATHNE